MELRESMIGFSGGNSWIQRCIRFFTGSDFSHSFVIIKDNDQLLALETTSTKVKCTPVENKLQENNWVEIWELSKIDDQIEIKIKSRRAKILYEGEWYGYLSYLWFIYRYICRKFKYEPKKMWKLCSFGITCTELTCLSLPKYKYPNQDINTIAPRELRDFVINNPDIFNFVGWYKKKSQCY